MLVFLSPHLDDAVLSCGGLIHQLVARGEAVHILTLMTGDAPPVDTPLTRDLHTRWALGDVMADRRAEDHAAAQRLGASVAHLTWPDCPYRTEADGTPLYPHNDDLFGPVHPADPARGLDLALPADTQTLYAPLGAGGHVDHQIVSRLGRELAQNMAVFFYEEYPYSASSGEGARHRAGMVGPAAVEAAQTRLGGTWRAHVIPLHEVDLQAKIAAIACYTSQISTFWDDTSDMAARVVAYAREITPQGAERLWIWKENIAS